MSRYDYLKGMILTVSAAVVLAILTKLIAGQRWFSFYGPAAVALLTLPAIAYLISARLKSIGRSRWLVLLYVLPVALLALVQIGYWTAFFIYGTTNPTLGIAREMVRINLGAALPWLTGVLLLLWAWLLLVTTARKL
jgi:hypothetical protein